jgi:homoserine trans-succinylase
MSSTRFEREGSSSQTRLYRGADKSLARPTSRYILFDGENISFDASLVICINSTNIPPVMIINRIYETQNLLSL